MAPLKNNIFTNDTLRQNYKKVRLTLTPSSGRIEKLLLKLRISARFERRPIKTEQKQLKIDIDILHQVGLEFDADSKKKKKIPKRRRDYKFGFLLKFCTPCILMDYLGKNKLCDNKPNTSSMCSVFFQQVGLF